MTKKDKKQAARSRRKCRAELVHFAGCWDCNHNTDPSGLLVGALEEGVSIPRSLRVEAQRIAEAM
jgi:hypothetical protein